MIPEKSPSSGGSLEQSNSGISHTGKVLPASSHHHRGFLEDEEEWHIVDDEIALEYEHDHPHHHKHPDLEAGIINSPQDDKEEQNGRDSIHSQSSNTSAISASLNQLHDPTYFPDGGTRAWLCTFGGFLAVFVTWGVITSFGPFNVYYHDTLLPNASSFQLGWISSLQLSTVFLGGVLTGRPFDNGYFYHLLIGGSVMVFVCFMLVAECKEYYQVLLAQGLGMGLGMGMLFGPCLACTSAYFKKHRGLAMCICSSGGGFGGVIFPIASNHLLGLIGFAWTIRVLAFIELFCLLIMIAIMRDRLPFEVRQKYGAQKHNVSIFSIYAWVDMTALKSPEFMFFVFGVSLCFYGLYIPFAQIQAFAKYTHIKGDISENIASILNSTSFIGRLVFFLIARYFGALNMTILFSLAASVTCFTLFTVKTDASMVVWALFYGFIAGIVGTFPPFCIPHLTQDITKLGTRFGMCFLSLSLFVSFSIPISGLVLGSEGRDYKNVSILCGSVFAAGGVLMTLGRVSYAGFKPKVV